MGQATTVALCCAEEDGTGTLIVCSRAVVSDTSAGMCSVAAASALPSRRHRGPRGRARIARHQVSVRSAHHCRTCSHVAEELDAIQRT